ncbi:MAG: hypothetical protein KBS41_04740 [Oscillospiraceae bacterium]|nr:hypothetical protein [Candidatus Equicaccousia limihippi]
MSKIDISNLQNEQYKKDNFRIQIVNENIDVCYVFFTSNGFWMDETFEDIVVSQDRYEWENLSKSEQIRSSAGKYIFIRDVYKHHYVDGINENIDSIDKIIDFLKAEVKGYNLITVGDSSGGYMAMIVGTRLNAQKIYSFGGIFSLYKWCGGNNTFTFNDLTYLTKYVGQEKSKYFDICNLIKEENIPIYHFFAAQSEADIIQINTVCANKPDNLFLFPLKEQKHGSSILPFCYPKVLTMDNESLGSVYKYFEGNDIDKKKFAVKILGFTKTVFELFKRTKRLAIKSLKYRLKLG